MGCTLILLRQAKSHPETAIIRIASQRSIPFVAIAHSRKPGGGYTLFEDIFRELTGETGSVQQVQQPVTQPAPGKPKNVSELNVKYKGYSNY